MRIEKGMMIAGRYMMEEPLGSGGMADVYKATDCKLGRAVAVKILKAEYASDENFVAKFRAEAQSVAGLEHPNIVHVYDVGVQEGTYFIVMEYVDGITLKSYIERKGRLNYKETLSIAIQAARGIRAAHASNIIHRDIKPQNIMISSDGKVKVTDFGIARAVSEQTIHSDVMGSVHYASPEQTRNGYISNRSDIYSLGVVMYEMVTGRVPFDGESAVEVAIKHLQDEMESPSTYAPDLPISLEKIILKCTQKSADRRYDSVDSLLVDLRKALVTPYEDFVVISAADVGATRVLTEAEAREIQESAIASQYEDEDGDEEYEYEDEEEDEEEGGFFNRRMEKTVNILRIVVLVVIVAIVIYILLSFFGVIHFGFNFGRNREAAEETADEFEMVSLLGMTLTEAQDEVADLDLIISQNGSEVSDLYEPGQIISQSVEPGEMIARGSVIQVVLAEASEEALTVPDVVGYTSDAANTTLSSAGFSVTREFQTSSDVAAGIVISQSPTAGTEAEEGATVTIVVSQGNESATVPSVIGKSESEARTLLGNAKLNVGTVTQDYSSSVKSGYVISQSVSAGSVVSSGTAVNLVVSKGAKETTYYIKSSISAPSGFDVQYADITLWKSESDEMIQYWSNISSFPFTVEVHGITGATQGTLEIEWCYTENGETKYSTQEETVTFKQE